MHSEDLEHANKDLWAVVNSLIPAYTKVEKFQAD